MIKTNLNTSGLWVFTYAFWSYQIIITSTRHVIFLGGASACNTSSSLRRLTSTKTSSAKWNDKCHTSLPCLTRIWFQKIFKVVMMFWKPKISMLKCPQKDVTNEHLQRCRMVHLELIHYEALQLIPETRGDFRPVFFWDLQLGKTLGLFSGIPLTEEMESRTFIIRG